MRHKGQVIFGTLVIIVGLVFLLAAILKVDVGILCLPTAFILLGVWLLLRPWLAGPNVALKVHLLGSVGRRGAWQVADEEMLLLVGDIVLDMTEAEIPMGETHLRAFGFVGDVTIRVPEGIGVAVSSSSFVSDVRFLGQKRTGVVAPVVISSPDYRDADRKIHLETIYFVASVRVRRA